MSTCRRMWTDRQIRSMAVDSVEEKENLEIFERIVDKDGHKRFIEGEIELADSITYLTNLYGKWSLSGSHLMLVICIRTDENTTVGGGSFTKKIELPEWVVSKITNLYGDYIDFKSFVGRDNSAGNATSFSTALLKSGSDIKIAFNSSISHSVPLNVRIQYDLLIDNE